MGRKKKVEIADNSSKLAIKSKGELKTKIKQRSYTAKFKKDCINYYLLHKGQKVSKVASNLGIPSGTFFDWLRKEGIETKSIKFNNKSINTNISNKDNSNNILLELEIRKLKSDIEVLKKALAIFINGVN